MKKKQEFICEECFKSFTTNRGRASHMRMHTKVEVEIPKPVITTILQFRGDENFRLKLGQGLNIGDKVKITKIGVVSRIEKRSDADYVDATVSKIDDSWVKI